MIVYNSMKESEVDRVYDLIVRVFHEHVAPAYSNKGIDTFLNMVSPAALLEANEGQGSFVIVARQENIIIGMLAVCKESHVALIFVNSQHQGKGIGKSLIDEAIKICRKRNPRLTAITVSSSPNSKTFYEGVGFTAQGEEVDEDGMRYTPMQRIVR